MYEYMHGNVNDIFNNISKEIEISMEWIFAMQMTFMYLMGDLFSIKIAEANLWNSVPLIIKNSTSNDLFKINMRTYLMDRKIIC